ncbi:Serine-protein kinase [Phytophthora fragariae]|uniref:non-specific serine/threonine protein kinase n=1 Tax=Phytophthora fragariae TaxID=53985 RepID=A0A6A3KKP6_9STRA|nr:Serine-protein kinase [Phytophthora fragariae]
MNDAAYGCMVDVDLLAVARAAVRVNMPYSAMQYLEMWLENHHGGKITSLSSLDNDNIVSTLRDILVEAYSFDSDGDGIYGVNDGRTVKSQLLKYNREDQYANALPLYDISLQFSNQHVLDRDGTASSNTTQLVGGMLASLQSLGYNHLLDGYLQSLDHKRQPTNRSSGLAASQALEHKYKLAWKRMQWEAVLPTILMPQDIWSKLKAGSKTSATDVFSHQQMLFQGLRAVAHGDFRSLQRVTSKAKEQIIQSVQLSLHSFESTKDSYSALVYLQGIHEIEELADFMRKSSPVVDSPILSTVTPTGLKTYSSSLDGALVTSRQKSLTTMPLLEWWQRRHGQIKDDFDKAESLLGLEEVLLQVSKATDEAQVLTKLYLDLASLSRKAGRIAVAYRALMKLEQLDERGSLNIYDKMQWQIQKAKLLWKQQEARSAIWTGKKLCSELTAYLDGSSMTGSEATSLQLLHVKVLTITGKWIASLRSESSQVILEDFFQKATNIINGIATEAVSERARDTSKAHFALAEFMAAMYQQVSTRVASREWLAGKKVVNARFEELQELTTLKEHMQNENRAHIHALNKEVKHDVNERSKVEASVDQFLIGALCSYGKGLSLSSQAELDMVFRVLSLWFTNQRKADINRVVIEEVIDMVSSYKFVPLSYQIISRISSSSDTGTFQIALHKLVMKMSVQHPHHTLIQLIALKNSGDVEGKGALQFRTNVGDAKAEGAKVYLAELMKTEQRELLESLDSMANAYVQLALFDTSEYHGQKKKIPLSKVTIFETNSGRSGTAPFDQYLRARTRRGGSTVMPAVLTSHISPEADMDYSNVVRTYSFEPHFSITDSGIHRPKIIYCHGSDGESYKQLVKGHDDTRQDLVIEQVFDTMNQFLMEEKATRKRKLRLRTYRVVPLSPIAGVLEWVENTTPWGSYLVSRTSKKLSAHERYHPHEWKHTECRQYLKNAPEKLPAFLEIQANFTPVFHHFFLERFPDAAVWYHRRLAYVQSTAVTSIVGYILGIGDRHSQNILIHEGTGELVHIDFGVVFDQGMALYTPETVPFRLTRDMVDGMGVSGVDGVFSRCCEVTLQLLRKKSASVVTILEVFVHDPLYRWTLSPLKALRIQEGEEEQDRTKPSVRSRSSSRSNSSKRATGTGNTNETQPADEMHAEPGSADAAARALIRVKQKLEGYEDPNGSALSIEGQVKHLLSVAQDPHNLCKLFPGWAPWL